MCSLDGAKISIWSYVEFPNSIFLKLCRYVGRGPPHVPTKFWTDLLGRNLSTSGLVKNFDALWRRHFLISRSKIWHGGTGLRYLKVGVKAKKFLEKFRR